MIWLYLALVALPKVVSITPRSEIILQKIYTIEETLKIMSFDLRINRYFTKLPRPKVVGLNPRKKKVKFDPTLNTLMQSSCKIESIFFLSSEYESLCILSSAFFYGKAPKLTSMNSIDKYAVYGINFPNELKIASSPIITRFLQIYQESKGFKYDYIYHDAFHHIAMLYIINWSEYLIQTNIFSTLDPLFDYVQLRTEVLRTFCKSHRTILPLIDEFFLHINKFYSITFNVTFFKNLHTFCQHYGTTTENVEKPIQDPPSTSPDSNSVKQSDLPNNVPPINLDSDLEKHLNEEKHDRAVLIEQTHVYEQSNKDITPIDLTSELNAEIEKSVEEVQELKEHFAMDVKTVNAIEIEDGLDPLPYSQEEIFIPDSIERFPGNFLPIESVSFEMESLERTYEASVDHEQSYLALPTMIDMSALQEKKAKEESTSIPDFISFQDFIDYRPKDEEESAPPAAMANLLLQSRTNSPMLRDSDFASFFGDDIPLFNQAEFEEDQNEGQFGLMEGNDDGSGMEQREEIASVMADDYVILPNERMRDEEMISKIMHTSYPETLRLIGSMSASPILTYTRHKAAITRILEQVMQSWKQVSQEGKYFKKMRVRQFLLSIHQLNLSLYIASTLNGKEYSNQLADYAKSINILSAPRQPYFPFDAFDKGQIPIIFDELGWNTKVLAKWLSGSLSFAIRILHVTSQRLFPLIKNSDQRIAMINNITSLTKMGSWIAKHPLVLQEDVNTLLTLQCKNRDNVSRNGHMIKRLRSRSRNIRKPLPYTPFGCFMEWTYDLAMFMQEFLRMDIEFTIYRTQYPAKKNEHVYKKRRSLHEQEDHFWDALGTYDSENARRIITNTRDTQIEKLDINQLWLHLYKQISVDVRSENELNKNPVYLQEYFYAQEALHYCATKPDHLEFNIAQGNQIGQIRFAYNILSKSLLAASHPPMFDIFRRHYILKALISEALNMSYNADYLKFLNQSLFNNILTIQYYSMFVKRLRLLQGNNSNDNPSSGMPISSNNYLQITVEEQQRRNAVHLMAARAISYQSNALQESTPNRPQSSILPLESELQGLKGRVDALISKKEAKLKK